jgi:DMSO/TMAO reductase YedYZ molybdopterin-dependent catalytic subunit
MLIAILAAAALHLGGDVPAADFSVADLKALGSETAEWTVHGQKHAATGVPLDKLLAKVGFSTGAMGKDISPKEKRSGWKKVLLATASDGFEAAFSCAELFPEMGPTHALIVWEIDGKPLPEGQAPLRLVVTTDKEPSRSLYKLTSIEVIDLRKR